MTHQCSRCPFNPEEPVAGTHSVVVSGSEQWFCPGCCPKCEEKTSE